MSCVKQWRGYTASRTRPVYAGTATPRCTPPISSWRAIPGICSAVFADLRRGGPLPALSWTPRSTCAGNALMEVFVMKVVKKIKTIRPRKWTRINLRPDRRRRRSRKVLQVVNRPSAAAKWWFRGSACAAGVIIIIYRNFSHFFVG